MRWRHEAVAAALREQTKGILDGTEEGNRYILERYIKPVRKDVSSYVNGSYQWCGAFMQYCWRAAHFGVPWNLHSAWRIRFPYAEYSPHHMGGPHYMVFRHPSGAIGAATVEEVHNLYEVEPRRYYNAHTDSFEVEPGDCILHLPKGKSKGHVMMALAYHEGVVMVAEGNHSKALGITGKGYKAGSYGEDLGRREGVGIRFLHIDDKYINWVVKPCSMDFVQGYEYFPTMDKAQQRAEELS